MQRRVACSIARRHKLLRRPVGLLKAQLTPITAADRLVLGRMLLIHTARQHTALLVEVEAEEERHAVPIDRAPVEHSVHG